MAEATLREGLERTLERTELRGFDLRQEGKVRDGYVRGDARWLVATDRISAFDRVLGTIPWKGQVLTRLSARWFEWTKHVVPSHFVRVADPCVTECVDVVPLLVEMVVRAYATGNTSTSLWTHYERGERTFCGHALPDGLRKHEKLPKPILTPSTKAPKGEHDVSGSREDILRTGLVREDDFDVAADMSMKLFADGETRARERGVLLVDTKYEFGKTKDGRIVVIDEIHTPDCSRFWLKDSYAARFAAGEEPERFDKDVLRVELARRGYRGEGVPPSLDDDLRLAVARRYVEVFERLTGEEFVPDMTPPGERLGRFAAKQKENR